MAVYFALRSHYEGPASKYLCRYEDATVLDWFRNHWTAPSEGKDAWAVAREVMGTRVYGFASLFKAIGEQLKYSVERQKRLTAEPGTIQWLNQVGKLGTLTVGSVGLRPYIVYGVGRDDGGSR